jgi:hypothetical protein
MLETTAIVFALLWLLSVALSCTFGGYVHVLLLASLGAILVLACRGNRRRA